MECCLGCHEALVLECERQVRVAGRSGSEIQPTPRSRQQAPVGAEIAGTAMVLGQRHRIR